MICHFKKKIKSIIVKETIPLPVQFHYWLLKLLSDCKICYDGIMFPLCGVAPHRHDTQMHSYILPENEWPDNYVDTGNNNGIYYCTNKDCQFSKENQHKQLYELYNKIT